MDEDPQPRSAPKQHKEARALSKRLNVVHVNICRKAFVLLCRSPAELSLTLSWKGASCEGPAQKQSPADQQKCWLQQWQEGFEMAGPDCASMIDMMQVLHKQVPWPTLMLLMACIFQECHACLNQRQ